MAADVAIEDVMDFVRQAGERILAVYHTDFDVISKDDESPLTEADLAANAVIVEALERLDPDTPILSEESEYPPFDERRHWQRYWLIDPLDGTKEFVHRDDEFTVNVALIEDGEVVLGVVGAPVWERMYVGDCRREPLAFREDASGREPLCVVPASLDEITVVASRRHGGERLEAYLTALGERFSSVRRRPVGSSLKFCILAEGEADFYPRLGPTSEWDIAAGHGVLKAAGGRVTWSDGSPVRYNAKESLGNGDFLAVADAAFDWDACLPRVPDSV